MAVSFEGAPHVPQKTQDEITERLKEYVDADYPNYLGEEVKEVLQDEGYYYAEVRTQSRVLSSDRAEQKTSVTFYVVEGMQYQLGGIEFVHGLVFPPTELRKRIPLQDGDIFDLGKLRVGIGALTTLYGSQGYINFTANPQLEVDIAHQTISVRLELEEDMQFRVEKAQVFGLDPRISVDDLRIPFKPGDIFNDNLIYDFFEENQDVLLSGLSPQENVHVIQDPRSDTVTIVYDVRACRAHPE